MDPNTRSPMTNEIKHTPWLDKEEAKTTTPSMEKDHENKDNRDQTNEETCAKLEDSSDGGNSKENNPKEDIVVQDEDPIGIVDTQITDKDERSGEILKNGGQDEKGQLKVKEGHPDDELDNNTGQTSDDIHDDTLRGDEREANDSDLINDDKKHMLDVNLDKKTLHCTAIKDEIQNDRLETDKKTDSTAIKDGIQNDRLETDKKTDSTAIKDGIQNDRLETDKKTESKAIKDKIQNERLDTDQSADLTETEKATNERSPGLNAIEDSEQNDNSDLSTERVSSSKESLEAGREITDNEEINKLEEGIVEGAFEGEKKIIDGNPEVRRMADSQGKGQIAESDDVITDMRPQTSDIITIDRNESRIKDENNGSDSDSFLDTNIDVSEHENDSENKENSQTSKTDSSGKDETAKTDDVINGGTSQTSDITTKDPKHDKPHQEREDNSNGDEQILTSEALV